MESQGLHLNFGFIYYFSLIIESERMVIQISQNAVIFLIAYLSTFLLGNGLMSIA
jgi:hypothetical protein